MEELKELEKRQEAILTQLEALKIEVDKLKTPQMNQTVSLKMFPNDLSRLFYFEIFLLLLGI